MMRPLLKLLDTKVALKEITFIREFTGSMAAGTLAPYHNTSVHQVCDTSWNEIVSYMYLDKQ